MWQEHLSHDVDCDKLQRIHTMENLAEVLEYVETGTEGGHTLRDDTLVEEVRLVSTVITSSPVAVNLIGQNFITSFEVHMIGRCSLCCLKLI